MDRLARRAGAAAAVYNAPAARETAAMSTAAATWIAIGAYCAAMLAIGAWAARRTRDAADFFLGGRRLGPWLAALSQGATQSSAWTLVGVSGAAFAWGLSAAWIWVSVVAGYAVNWFWIAPRLRRLSVAVILDNKPAPAGAAVADVPAAGVAWSEEDIARFTTIVKEAVGFDEARGDRVQVVNAGFTTAPGLGEVEPEPAWKSPALWNIGRQALGAALVLVLAFVVLRPLMKSLTAGGAAGGALVPAGVAGLPDLAQDRVTLTRGGVPAPNYEQQVAAARSLIGQDPRRAADVVKDWVTTDGR